MLVNMRDLLLPAQKEHYAVGYFNIINLEMARAVVETAQELGAPVMVGVAQRLLADLPLEYAADLLLPMARRASVPVCVHLDHADSFDCCIQALRAGFTSVMFDCSKLDYETNIQSLAELVRVCHAAGVSVEGELGQVAGVEGSDRPAEDSGVFTDPAIAADFSARTGVDALAVSIGNAHGAYKGIPRLDFPRLSAIAERTPTPLVLHGGSGLSDEDFRTAIGKGICKINIYTEINQAGKAGLEAGLRAGCTNVQALIPYELEAMKRVTAEKLTLFGCTGRSCLPLFRVLK